MKNLLKILGLSVLVSFIALGCSNTSGDAISNGNGVTAKKTATKVITLVATGEQGAIDFRNPLVSPTIVADTVTASSLKYYLFYKNLVTGVEKNPTESTNFTPSATSPNVGTVPLSIEDGYYKFWLYATEATPATLTDAGVKAVALFLGQTEADLRTSTDTVSFYLTSDGIGGSANVSIKLLTTGWTVPSGYTASARITNKTDGNTASGTTVASGISITSTAPATAQYTQTNVTAGTYNFEVAFENSTLGKTYVWSDTIIVAPNHNIVKEVSIPDVIGLPPAAPSDFLATFKNPTTVTAGSYEVEFDWKAEASVNEAYFQIELLEIPSGPTYDQIADDTDTDWDATYMGTLGVSDTNITILDKNFYGNEAQNWIKGSLRKNNTRAVVALPLGKRYLARIAAVNDAGNSPYRYVDFKNTAVTPDTGYNKFAADAKVINRYRLTYNLLGGTRKTAGATPTTSTEDMVEYRTQNDKANSTANTYAASVITSGTDVPSADIWDPAEDTDTYESLIKNGKAWTTWRLDSSTSASYYPSYNTSNLPNPYNPPDYTEFENLTLFASYSPVNVGVTILDDNDWTLSVANFDASAMTDPGVDPSNLSAKSIVKFNSSATGAGSIKWTAAYTAAQTAAGVKWTSATYTIRKADETTDRAGPNNISLSDTGFEATTEFKNYVPGKYYVTFNVYAPHKTEPYTCTVVVDVIEQE